MSHREHLRHRPYGRDPYDSAFRTYTSTSSDSLPGIERMYYYEVAPGSMIHDQVRAAHDPFAAVGAPEMAAVHREPRIHYDSRTWSKNRARQADTGQSALVVMAVSLFAVSLVAGTVLFAYYILSCYGIY